MRTLQLLAAAFMAVVLAASIGATNISADIYGGPPPDSIDSNTCTDQDGVVHHSDAGFNLMDLNCDGFVSSGESAAYPGPDNPLPAYPEYPMPEELQDECDGPPVTSVSIAADDGGVVEVWFYEPCTMGAHAAIGTDGETVYTDLFENGNPQIGVSQNIVTISEGASSTNMEEVLWDWNYDDGGCFTALIDFNGAVLEFGEDECGDLGAGDAGDDAVDPAPAEFMVELAGD